MRLIALDIGTRRTGAAFIDEHEIVFPLDTLHHRSTEDLAAQVYAIAQARKIDHVLVGLPLLLSGNAGTQVAFVQECIERLRATGLTIDTLDERYTTPTNTYTDGDASAACQLLTTFVERAGK